MLRLWLTFIQDGEDRYTLALPQESSLMVGRDESVNDLVVHDSGVSRLHARFAFHGTQYVVQDVHSKAGTFVNGERVKGLKPLASGDLVVIGDLTLRATIRDWALPDDEGTETLMG